MRAFTFLLLSLFLSSACSTGDTHVLNDPTTAKPEVVVSAAVSLKDAFTEIGSLYRSRTGTEITFNFGSSGALQKQIETGAPADVFASAGTKQMDELAAKGFIDVGSRHDLAGNTLVIIVPRDSKLDLRSTADLARPEVEKIAVGNPKTVPAGQYTEQFFQEADLWATVQPKLILAEDVRQVLDYVSRGEVDAGIAYATDAKTAGDKVKVISTIPADHHDPILYPIAVIKDAKNRKAAEEFLGLVMSTEGQAILQKYGLAAPHSSEK